MQLRSNHKITVSAMLVAVGILLGYIEFLFPLPIGIPGVKIGLSNIITLLALDLFGPLIAIYVLILRVVLSSILFGNTFSLLYSLTGALFAYIFMFIFQKLKLFSIIGISIIGGFAHNIGQLIVAYFVVKQIKIFFYLPILCFAGLISGLLVGVLSNILIKRLSNIRGY